MQAKNLLIALAISLCFGCTSFRTSILSRFENDSVAKQQTNQRLTGLPVKLKVPSHVLVTIQEQQVILANDKAIVDAKNAAANDKLKKVVGLEGQIEELDNNIDAENAKLEAIVRSIELLDATIATSRDMALVEAAIKLKPKKEEARLKAVENVDTAVTAKVDTLPGLEAQLLLARGAAAIASRENNVAIGYTLISFDPAQYVVKTELLYTDKIFLVDFKRPAGGILDLKEASMDDEQYFSKIQAEIQERTLADVSTALQTVTKLKSPSDSNQATPTSANTSEGEANVAVNFQESLVAMQRFDISEPHWEERMMTFVNERLGSIQSQMAIDGLSMGGQQ